MDRKPSELLVALRFPYDVMENLLEIDSLYDKMEAQKVEEDTKKSTLAAASPDKKLVAPSKRG